MKTIIVYLICCIFVLQATLAIPIGAISPGCSAPQPADNNTRWCHNAYNIDLSASIVTPSMSYCAPQGTKFANTIQTAFAGIPAVAPSYTNGGSYANGGLYRIRSFCQFFNLNTTFTAACRYFYEVYGPYDANLPGFWRGNNSALSSAYLTVNTTSRVYSTYCQTENDTTVATSLVMPNYCVTIFNNQASMNVCEPMLMENIPPCDSIGNGTRVSSNYNGGGTGYFASRGLSLCQYFIQTDNTVFNGAPYCGESNLVTTTGYSAQTCGNVVPAIYATSNPYVKTVSIYNPNASVVSAASSMENFFY
jgi:hypothetical protein